MRKIYYLMCFLCEKDYIKVCILLFLFILFFSGCDKDEENMNLTIASKQITKSLEHHDYDKCYIVKKNEEQEWSLFSSPIDGFDYREGYEYVIYVTAIKISHPPMDGSSMYYKLNYIISCVEKESENIPAFWFDK
jgi:hypothetical protein